MIQSIPSMSHFHYGTAQPTEHKGLSRVRPALAMLRMQSGVGGSSSLVQGQRGLEGGREHPGTWVKWKPHCPQ